MELTVYLNEKYYCETEYANLEAIYRQIEDEGYTIEDISGGNYHVFITATGDTK